MKLADHGVLEPWLQRQRLQRVIPYILPGARVLDLGCGRDAALLRSVSARIHAGVGVDTNVPVQSFRKLRFLRIELPRRLPFRRATFTHVSLLASLQYFDAPLPVLRECRRVLKSDGTLLITVPSVPKFLFVVLSCCGLVDPELAKRISHFYTVRGVADMLRAVGFHIISIQKFQFGLNNLIIARR